MLKCFSILLILLTITSALAESEVFGRFATIKLLPVTARIGERVSILVYPEKFDGDIPLELIVKAKFENQEGILDRFGKDLWRFKTPVLTEARSYAFKAEIYIEDKKQADLARKEIEKLSVKISHIEFQIQNETDPVVLQNLIKERDQLNQDRIDLLSVIDSLRKYLGTETFTFIPVN